MEILKSILLGLIQGITEFIPISSTAHLRIVPEILGWEDPGAEFSAVIQLGTLVAVLLYFRKDIKNISSAAIISLKNRNLFESTDSRLAWSILAGNIPLFTHKMVRKFGQK